MQTTYKVLVVDDEESILKLLKRELSTPERTVHTAHSAREARKMMERTGYDVLILDIKLPDGDGLDLFTEFKAGEPDIEVVLITGHGDIDSAVEAMRIGVYDYMTKPFKLDRLELVLDRAFQRVALQRENRGLRHTQDTVDDGLRLVGKSEPIKHVNYLIEKLRTSEVPVLITGESGAGKDVVARKIHSRSKRAEHPLIIKNCAMLQRELVRSELFGHRKGAFTGASETREGLISLATRARCSWTRSAICPRTCKPPCCGCWKPRRSGAWGKRGAPGGRALSFRHQPQPGQGGGERAVQRGALPPHQRVQYPSSPAQ